MSEFKPVILTLPSSAHSELTVEVRIRSVFGIIPSLPLFNQILPYGLTIHRVLVEVDGCVKTLLACLGGDYSTDFLHICRPTTL